jgi:nucleoid DNA-binding protein
MDLKVLAEENNVSEFLLKNVYNHFFKYIKEEMSNNEGNTIHIQELGKIKVNPRIIKHIISAHIKTAKSLKNKGKDNIKIKEKIKILWKIRNNTWNTIKH